MYQDIFDAIDNRIKELSAFLTSGRAGDYSSYRSITGTIAGLLEAKDIIRLSIDAENSSDDDDLFN